MAAFRPLQPAPMDQERSPQPQTRPLTQKPKRTVTLGACAACRKRKSKCDGLRPTCRCCALKETDCVYEMGPHEKPSQAMKRKNEEMHGELSNLRELYEYLRFRPEQEALEILRRIRQTDPHTSPRQHVQQLAITVRNGGFSAQNQQSPTTRQQRELTMLPSIRAAIESVDFGPSSASTPRFPHSILRRDIENPIRQKRRYISVSARVAANADTSSHKPIETISEHTSNSHSQPSDPRLRSAVNWTSLTDDADFVAHLLSQWHRWEYRYYHFLDWDLFLDHMASGKKDFCSELLVNALLASAGFQSPMVNDRSKPFGANFITYFYSEARRQWDIEARHSSLPRLQAAMVLFMVLGKLGRDTDGYHFLEEACRMARELGLAGSEYPATPCPVNVREADWSRVRAVTAWSLFNFQMLMSCTYPMPPLLTSLPPMIIPGDGADHEEVLFRSECARQVIMLDVTKTLSELEAESEITPSSFERADKLYLRLQSWWNERPPALDPGADTSPENLLCAMNYHTLNIRLVRPFLRHNHNSTTKKTPSPHPSRPQSIYTTSLKSLRRLLNRHEAHHGWHDTIPYIVHAIVITSFGCLDEIATDKPSHFSLEMHESYLGLLTCLRGLNAIAGYIYYAQALFRLLAQACQALNVRLPRQITDAVERYRSEEWTREARSLVSSWYVADTRDAVDDLETRRMDAVIAQWEAFTIGKGKGRDLSEGRDWEGQGSDGSIAHEFMGEGLPLRSG